MDRKQIAIDFAKSLNHPEIEKIILFGSVARGDDSEESDIDIIILTRSINDEIKISDDVYTKVMDILLSLGERISLKIIPQKHYYTHKNFPFYTNVEKEEIIIG
ncbi:MAG: nucleotidyltransferase domain-containing protein [Methanobrevibacter sp.]|jgi:predicted nucleotidyltransferase|nr:nucleotidyltransferase domain-containing protein [Candidatus Methanovirga aequatorialis]